VTHGAANMAALSKQVAKIPDAGVADLVTWFVQRAEEVGGTFRFAGGRPVRLSARIKSKQSRGSTATTVLGGTPAAAWSIKSYGRRGGYQIAPRRREALSIGAVAGGAVFEHVTVRHKTSGDRRWDALVDAANDRFPDVVAELVDGSVRF